MALTNEQIEKISTKFSDVFSSEQKELGNVLYQDDEATYEDMVHEALVEEGFPPNDANYTNVEHEMTVAEGKSSEDWAETFISDHSIETKEEFDKWNNDDKAFRDTIIAHIEDTNITVIIKEDIEEWIEHNPTELYLADRMDSWFDKVALQEAIEQNYNERTEEKIQAVLNEEGFPNTVKPSDVNYVVKDARLETTFENLASHHIDDVTQNYNTVRDYLDIQFYSDIINNDDNYEYGIEVTSDIEDFK